MNMSFKKLGCLKTTRYIIKHYRLTILFITFTFKIKFKNNLKISNKVETNDI